MTTGAVTGFAPLDRKEECAAGSVRGSGNKASPEAAGEEATPDTTYERGVGKARAHVR